MNLFKSIEGFLESVDQTAAKTLGAPGNPSPPYIARSSLSSTAGTDFVASNDNHSTQAENSTSAHTQHRVARTPTRDDSTRVAGSRVKSDEELFAFLNTPKDNATQPLPKAHSDRGKRVATRGRGGGTRGTGTAGRAPRKPLVLTPTDGDKENKQSPEPDAEPESVAVPASDSSISDKASHSSGPGLEGQVEDTQSKEHLPVSNNSDPITDTPSSDAKQSATDTSQASEQRSEVEPADIANEENSVLENEQSAAEGSNLESLHKNRSVSEESVSAGEASVEQGDTQIEIAEDQKSNPEVQEDPDKVMESIESENGGEYEENTFEDDEQYEAERLEREAEVERLQRENVLLRNQVRALHEEVTEWMAKRDETDDALAQLQEKSREWQQELSEKERLVARLKIREDELGVVLSKKDSALAQLAQALQEANNRAEALQMSAASLEGALQAASGEQHRLGDESRAALQISENKYRELEASARAESDRFAVERNAASERERALQSELAEYAKAIAQAQRTAEDRQHKLSQAAAGARELQHNNSALRQELLDYKLKAKNVLAERDQAILRLQSQLRDAHPTDSVVIPGSAQLLQEQLEAAQQETARLKGHIAELTEEVASLRASLQEQLDQAQADVQDLEEHTHHLEESLQKERERVKSLQMELLQRSQEIAAGREQVEGEVRMLQEQLRSAHAETNALKRKTGGKSGSSTIELENSLRQMTDRLIRLQSQNETLASEKQALLLRLQTEAQHQREPDRPRRNMLGHIPPTTFLDQEQGYALSDPSDGPRLRSIASLVPQSWEEPQSRGHLVISHSLKAAHALDAFSARVGTMLRRNPLARLLLIIYVVVLHIWVLFLLSRPLEMHDNIDVPPGMHAVPGAG